jgi:hypothetical protein
MAPLVMPGLVGYHGPSAEHDPFSRQQNASIGTRVVDEARQRTGPWLEARCASAMTYHP